MSYRFHESPSFAFLPVADAYVFVAVGRSDQWGWIALGGCLAVSGSSWSVEQHPHFSRFAAGKAMVPAVGHSAFDLAWAWFLAFDMARFSCSW